MRQEGYYRVKYQGSWEIAKYFKEEDEFRMGALYLKESDINEKELKNYCNTVNLYDHELDKDNTRN